MDLFLYLVRDLFNLRDAHCTLRLCSFSLFVMNEKKKDRLEERLLELFLYKDEDTMQWVRSSIATLNLKSGKDERDVAALFLKTILKSLPLECPMEVKRMLQIIKEREKAQEEEKKKYVLIRVIFEHLFYVPMQNPLQFNVVQQANELERDVLKRISDLILHCLREREREENNAIHSMVINSSVLEEIGSLERSELRLGLINHLLLEPIRLPHEQLRTTVRFHCFSKKESAKLKSFILY